MTKTPRLIKLRFTTIDHFSESKTFKTLEGARAYFKRRMGDAFDISVNFNYAIDAYGVGKLSIVEGTTYNELAGREVM